MSWESWWNDHLLWKNSLEYYDFGNSSPYKEENVELRQIKRLKYCSPIDEIPDLWTTDRVTSINKSMSDHQSHSRTNSKKNPPKKKTRRSQYL